MFHPFVTSVRQWHYSLIGASTVRFVKIIFAGRVFFMGPFRLSVTVLTVEYKLDFFCFSRGERERAVPRGRYLSECHLLCFDGVVLTGV